MKINRALDFGMIALTIFGYFMGFYDAFHLPGNIGVAFILIGIAIIYNMLYVLELKKERYILLGIILVLYAALFPLLLNGGKMLLMDIFSKWRLSDIHFNIPDIQYVYSSSDLLLTTLLINVPMAIFIGKYYYTKKRMLIHHVPAILFFFIPILYMYFPSPIYFACFVGPMLTNYLTSYAKDAFAVRIISLAILMAIPSIVSNTIDKDHYTKFFDLTDLRVYINKSGSKWNREKPLAEQVDLNALTSRNPTDEIEYIAYSENVGSLKLIGRRFSLFENQVWKYEKQMNETDLWSVERRILGLTHDHGLVEMLIRTRMNINSNQYAPYFTASSGAGSYSYLIFENLYEKVDYELKSSQLSVISNYVSDHQEVNTFVPDNLHVVLQQLMEDANIQKEDTAIEILGKLREYYQQNFTYSYQIDALEDNQDFIENFIETKRGYCVHFATLSALVLRECNIMARYVEGYQVSEYDKDHYIIRNKDLHAWIEFFDQDIGWLPYEVTTTYKVEDSIPIHVPEGEIIPNTPGSQDVTPVGPDIKPTTPEKEKEDTPIQPIETQKEKFNLYPFIVAGSIILAIAIVRLIRQSRFNHFARMSNQQYILFLYHQLDILKIQLEPKELEIVLEAMYSNHEISNEATKQIEQAYMKALKANMNSYNQIIYYYYFYMKGQKND